MIAHYSDVGRAGWDSQLSFRRYRIRSNAAICDWNKLAFLSTLADPTQLNHTGCQQNRIYEQTGEHSTRRTHIDGPMGSA